MVNLVNQIPHQRPQRSAINDLLKLIEVVRALNRLGEIATTFLAADHNREVFNVRCQLLRKDVEGLVSCDLRR